MLYNYNPWAVQQQINWFYLLTGSHICFWHVTSRLEIASQLFFFQSQIKLSCSHLVDQQSIWDSLGTKRGRIGTPKWLGVLFKTRIIFMIHFTVERDIINSWAISFVVEWQVPGFSFWLMAISSTRSMFSSHRAARSRLTWEGVRLMGSRWLSSSITSIQPATTALLETSARNDLLHAPWYATVI